MPRIFALPPGVDFPRALADGLWHRLTGLSPEALARVEVFVNTRRMQRRLQAMMAQGRACLLPRIRLITDLGHDAALVGLPHAVPPLRRRLELAQLVARLLDAQPDLAPRAAIYDLADSLATLMDEMQGEGVGPDRIRKLDLSDHSAHWQRSMRFIDLVSRYFDSSQPPDAQARQRLVIERLAGHWAETPPLHPMIIAGSTGSRGATRLLMQAVARLPQGALVLPGFDFAAPPEAWATLGVRAGSAFGAEDHPQYRFVKLLDQLGAEHAAVTAWHPVPAPNPARNRLVSLSLRPAPVTDQWMIEGKLLLDLATATAGLTLIEAPSPRAEALAIALRLRKAAEDGTTAALITPDRGLSRQVTAALDRWGILPDDSAGRPLILSAPGRFLRHVAALFGRKLTAEALLVLLKHPLTASGAERGTHLRLTQDLELQLRKQGPHFPTSHDLVAWSATRAGAEAWGLWIAGLLEGLERIGTRPLAEHVAAHLTLAEGLAAGPGGIWPGALWQKPAGIEAAAATAELLREAGHGGAMSCADYSDLFAAILQSRDVREVVQAHPHIMIWGTLEARVQGADLVILGSMNDGIWPPAPAPDPWMNRKMRFESGLLLPDRQIGLSAHDYQQAIAAPEVVISRAVRNADSETVASRWLNRLLNLLDGLPDQGGTVALAAMRARGQSWVGMAAALDLPLDPVTPARRPAPRPPVEVRPRGLYVSKITTLIRDPYAVYAEYMLRLKPLDPLRQVPDARERGTVLHKILETFIHKWPIETPAQARARLMAVARQVVTTEVPWPAARRIWLARLDRVADWFLAQEAERAGAPAIIEKRGSVTLENGLFTLSAKPDRIDVLPDGRVEVIDYKTGKPPSAEEQRSFAKQLLLEAAMVERGGFEALGARHAASILYIGLGSPPKVVQTVMDASITARVWAELNQLINCYQRREQGYLARRAMHGVDYPGDYDQLSRFGEWQISDPAWSEDVG